MKKLLSSFVLLINYFQIVSAQEHNIRPPAIGISFLLNDFVTPQNIRTSSLGEVINQDKWARLGQMGTGLSLHYFKGLASHFDIAYTLSGSFSAQVYESQPEGSNYFLIETDASVNYNFLTEKHVFTPFLSAGIGASEIKSYYGAIVPVGAGFKINLYDEAAIFLTTQYRIPVTTHTNNFHFVYSLGIAGVIGQKKSNP